jgi:hypothetical protein
MKRYLSIIVMSLLLASCGQNEPIAATATSEPQATAVIPTSTAAEPTVAASATALPTALPATATALPATATALPATATALPATATALPATAVPTQVPITGFGEEILFLRGGNLWAHDLATQRERQIVEGVADFAAGPAGAQIALLRGKGTQREIWLVARDGSDLRQVTQNDRAEESLAWAPDATALIYASAKRNEPLVRDWLALPRWCLGSEIRTLDLATSAETTLAAGCEPAISPDGKRIAYTAPPTAAMPGFPADDIRVRNSVRLMNRLGQNGWDFAKAQNLDAFSDGFLVYAPAWAADGSQVLYQRYTGTQVEVDINLGEIGGSFEGKGQVIGEGAGVMLPARFAPHNKLVAITAYDAGNARGLVGYGAWSVQLIGLNGSREIFLPNGPRTVFGQDSGRLFGGQMVAWAPGGAALAVQLPVGWSPEADPEAWGEVPGEIWRWTGGATVSERLVSNVDYASNLAWLPAQ